MSQTDNNLFGSLSNIAKELGNALSEVNKLAANPQVKEALDKELGGEGKFNSEMEKTLKELGEVTDKLKDIKL